MVTAKKAKQQFVAALNPLLAECEAAIVAGDIAESQRLSLAVLKLVEDYADKLDPAELKDALNNPTANNIAKRLGVSP